MITTSRALAIDPAIRSPGAALFVDCKLVAAARIKVPAAVHAWGEGDRLGERVQEVGRLIAAWYVLQAIELEIHGDKIDVVYEWPQIYRAKKSKGDPNDLLKVAACGTAAVARLAHLVSSVTTPRPRDWAGSTKKTTTGPAWDSERGRMIKRRLTDDELALVPEQHDAIDAVGLGLWKVGRFAPIRVYPGATPG